VWLEPEIQALLHAFRLLLTVNGGITFFRE